MSVARSRDVSVRHPRPRLSIKGALALPSALSVATGLVVSACGAPDAQAPIPEEPDRPEAGVGAAGSINLGFPGPRAVQRRDPSVYVPETYACPRSDLTGCVPFAGQELAFPVFRRVLYSWTTQEQADELRANRQLFTRTERPGRGPGYAFVALERLAEEASDEQGMLALQLRTTFAKARFAWHNPWATRLGWPGEDYGNQLLRIELKPEAWLVRFNGSSLRVETSTGEGVAIADALSNPERIGLIFFERDWQIGGPACSSFTSGSDAYREFIVGNEQMIESWSLATQDIKTRLQDDIENLKLYLARVRVDLPSFSDFSRSIACRSWFITDHRSTRPIQVDSYEASLAIPSRYYEPTPRNIARLIETLSGDLPTISPLIVHP